MYCLTLLQTHKHHPNDRLTLVMMVCTMSYGSQGCKINMVLGVCFNCTLVLNTFIMAAMLL